MRKRVLHAAAIWLAGMALAAVGVTAALSLLGAGILGGGRSRVLSQADVQRELAQQAPASPAVPSPGPATSRPGHAPSPSSSRSPAPSMFHAAGGTVFASCSAGQATLTRRIPAQGYQTDSYSRGPAASAWVRFQNGGTEQTVTVTCAGDHPRFAAPLDGDTGGGGTGGGGTGGGDDHSGGSGDDHGGSGGSGRGAGGGGSGGSGGGGSGH